MPARTALDELGNDGSFKRKDAAWRSWISRGMSLDLPKRFSLQLVRHIVLGTFRTHSVTS